MKWELLARLVGRSGLRPLLTSLCRWSGVLCVNYHRIGDGADSVFDRGLWSATASDFAWQVQFLKSHLDVISPGDLPAVLARGNGRHALITFDDGYADNYTKAFPILKAHRVPAAFFVSTGFLDDPRVTWWDEIAWMVRMSPKTALELPQWLPQPVTFDAPDREQAVRALLRKYKALAPADTRPFLEAVAVATGTGRYVGHNGEPMWMTWDMLREMKRAGMTIGGHTVNHPVLANMPAEAQRCEIVECGRRLLDELGEPMRYFSYPVGGVRAFNDDTRECLRECGVEYAFSYYGGYRRTDDWDNYDIRRVPIETCMTRDWFRAIVQLPRLFSRPF